MTSVHRLRLLFEKKYAILAPDAPHKAQPLQAFLALPIRERLILLALLDQQGKPDEAAIRQAIPYAKQSDVRLTSKTILKAVETLKAAIERPTLWIHPGPYPEREVRDLTIQTAKPPVPDALIPYDIEKTLTQIFYPSAAVCLFGGLVPPEVREFSLQARCCLYLLVVECQHWGEVEELLGVSKWFVRQAIHNALEALT